MLERTLNIQQQVDLQPYNTLAVPAIAAYFVEIQEIQGLYQALDWNKQRKLPLLILGGGSNIILRENFPGLVLYIRLTGVELLSEDDRHVCVKVGAGENWHQLVSYCLSRAYWGLENLSLIPGSVGAAPIQNIGAYGVELKDVFDQLQAIDISTGECVNFDRLECDFGYRESVFKNQSRDRYIITSVTLRLQKQQQLNLSYPALREAVERSGKQPTAELVSELVCSIRRSKLPLPDVLPNVGSFFKNPVVEAAQYNQLKQTYPNIVAFGIDQEKVKLASGWMIEKAGWRGFKGEGVAVHDQQALVLVNPGRCWGRDVLDLAEKIRTSVLAKFGVELEMEPRIYP